MLKPFIPEKLPITTIQWEPLIHLVGKANRALAHYGGILKGLRNPGVLLSPLTTQEAVLSSRIEGTRATLGDVLKHEAGEDPKDDQRKEDIVEIMNYRRALHDAIQELRTRPFTLNLLLKLHSVLLDSVRGHNKARGFFRKTQNYIGKAKSPIEQAVYIPPPPERLMEFLYNWEKYYHEQRPDPLVQLAIIHAQFEIIHPFLDGNGRLGRMIVPLFLFEKGLLPQPMFYISSYLDENRNAYVSSLRDLSEPGHWNQWIEFFLRGVETQAEKNAKKAQQVMALYERMKEQVIALTHSQYAVPLLDKMFETPIFKTTTVTASKGMPSKPMVMTMISQLKKSGLLKVLYKGSGRRAQVLTLSELVNLCEGKKVFRE